jgi:hypothetical protein
MVAIAVVAFRAEGGVGRLPWPRVSGQRGIAKQTPG